MQKKIDIDDFYEKIDVLNEQVDLISGGHVPTLREIQEMDIASRLKEPKMTEFLLWLEETLPQNNETKEIRVYLRQLIKKTGVII